MGDRDYFTILANIYTAAMLVALDSPTVLVLVAAAYLGLAISSVKRKKMGIRDE